MTHHFAGPTFESDRHRRRSAAAILALAGAGVICLALACRDPMQPLRLAAKWSLEWRGARFIGLGGARLQASLNDCGPTALADFLELEGRPVPSRDSLFRLTRTGGYGTTLAQLETAAKLSGLRVFAVAWSPMELRDLPVPSLAWVDHRHFVVVARRDATDSVEVHDPAAGRYRMATERFARVWSGAALVPLDSISPSRERRLVGRAIPSPVGHTGTSIQNDGGLK